jgi:cyclopropane-fatty-acyl-phospholipid synthase
LRYLVSPDLMKLGQAYVEGHLDVEGQLADIFADVEAFARSAARRSKLQGVKSFILHTRRRDRDAIQYHYDVSDDFYRLFLDAQMVYSCAYFRSESDTLAQAQVHKIDHILHKLQLRRGERLLDIGCGWGALVIRAAQEHGAHAVGITLSENQYAWAQRRVKEEGLEGRVEIRLQDYRDVRDGPYDAVSSIGMFEHVGLRNLGRYFGGLRRLLRPGGRLLNHGIGRPSRRGGPTRGGVPFTPPRLRRNSFVDRYVFPDGELHEVGAVVSTMQANGFEVRHLESLREHYALTLRAWVANLEHHWDEAVAEVGPGRARIWHLYMAACALNFEAGRTQVHQVLGVRPDRGRSGMPLRPLFEG